MEDSKIKLEEIKRKNIHKVPEGYFDELPLRIQSRINSEKASKPSYVFNIRPVWGMAAAAMLLIIGYLIYPADIAPTANSLLSEVDSEALIDYLEMENVSTDDILASIDTEFLLEDLSENEIEWFNESESEESLNLLYESIEAEIELI